MGGADVITRVLTRVSGELGSEEMWQRKQREGDVMQDHKPRHAGGRWSLEAGKDKEAEASRRKQSCGHLDFNPHGPISSF